MAATLRAEELAPRALSCGWVAGQLTSTELWLSELGVDLAEGGDHMVKRAADVVVGEAGM